MKGPIINLTKRIRKILNLRKLTHNELLFNSLGGDGIKRELFNIIIESFGIKVIIETGTHMGSTTYFIANTFPDIWVYSCEVNEDFFRIASKNLKGMKNIRLSLSNSTDFIKQVVACKQNEDILFYLDAHWDDYWPLRDEMEFISEEVSSCVIIIDDFMVPNRKDYAFGFNGGKGTSAAPGPNYQNIDVFNLPDACSLDLIAPFLSKEKHAILLPSYSYEEMKEYSQNPVFGNLIGYVCIMQNQKKGLAPFMSSPIVKKHFSIHNL